jgi:hypothetical protein
MTLTGWSAHVWRGGCRYVAFSGVGEQSQGLSMMDFTELTSAPSPPLAPFTDQLRLAAAAYLARFKGSSREHTESDLRSYLAWCAERGLDPLAARRPHLDCTSGGCKRSAGSGPSPCPGGSR